MIYLIAYSALATHKSMWQNARDFTNSFGFLKTVDLLVISSCCRSSVVEHLIGKGRLNIYK